MEKSYLKKFNQLEKSKELLLHKLEKRDSEFLITRKNGKWSPVEHCYHVFLAEMYSRKYCVKKLSYNPELKDAGIKTQLRLWTLKLSEVLPIKFKAPKTINEQVFPEDLNLEMIFRVWGQERNELKNFLENLDA